MGQACRGQNVIKMRHDRRSDQRCDGPSIGSQLERILLLFNSDFYFYLILFDLCAKAFVENSAEV